MAHFDLMSPRKDKNGNTRWHKVGAAFPRDKGGFSLTFDSLPLPDEEGRVSLMMWESKPREDRGGGDRGYRDERRDDGYGQRQQQRQQGEPRSRDVDDDIPF